MNRMKNVIVTCVLGFAANQAVAEAPESSVYDRKGELSPGTQAPSVDAMVRIIEQGSPQALFSTLEYGERVMCRECVPLLQAKLLGSDEPRVREIAAWWLRRQPFAAGAILGQLRTTLAKDDDAVRRARAAEALGEFMDAKSFEPLAKAASSDGDANVRAAAVTAIARLNMEASIGAIVEALGDKSKAVKLAALGSIVRVNFFRERDALIPLLSDDSAEVRRRAARLCGELRAVGAEKALAGLLAGDDEASVRQAAAWALGRIGGELAHTALSRALEQEDDQGVLDALKVARAM